MNNISICWSSNRYLVIWMYSLWIINMKYMTLCMTNNMTDVWYICEWIIFQCVDLPVDIWSFGWILYELSTWNIWHFVMTNNMTDVWYICEWIIFQYVDLPIDIWSFGWILYELSTWNIWHFVWQITWQTFDTFVNE
jgi:hypothetical protein